MRSRWPVTVSDPSSWKRSPINKSGAAIENGGCGETAGVQPDIYISPLQGFIRKTVIYKQNI